MPLDPWHAEVRPLFEEFTIQCPQVQSDVVQLINKTKLVVGESLCRIFKSNKRHNKSITCLIQRALWVDIDYHNWQLSFFLLQLEYFNDLQLRHSLVKSFANIRQSNTMKVLMMLLMFTENHWLSTLQHSWLINSHLWNALIKVEN